MMLPGVLNTVIVLAGLYAALSVLCSFVNETIFSLVQLRGKTLYKGVFNLLANSKALTQAIYEHPLIWSGSSDQSPDKSLPSYIDARNFSIAFWHTVQQSTTGPRADAVAVVLDTPERVLSDIKAKVAALPTGTAAGAAAVGAAAASGPAAERTKADALTALKGTLTNLIVEADGDYTRLLAATDAWFDRQMDRVSGWYRRCTQWNLIAIGFIIAFGFGIDSLGIATRMYSDEGLRNAVSSQVANSYNAIHNDPSISALTDPNAKAQAFAQKLDQNFSNQLTDNVPLTGFIDTNLADFFWKRFTNVHAFLGALITGLAISLGAPFWFDLLGGLTNVRMAGTKPADVSPPAPPPAGPPAPTPVPAG